MLSSVCLHHGSVPFSSKPTLLEWLWLQDFISSGLMIIITTTNMCGKNSDYVQPGMTPQFQKAQKISCPVLSHPKKNAAQPECASAKLVVQRHDRFI